MSWIKKGPVLAVLGAFLLAWAFVFFFFDPMLKAGLIAGGQAAAGAKVEIGSLRSKWLKGTLEITDIAVANREEPMENVIELARAGFTLDTSALVRGKGVVREAALEGMRFGTPRRSSGALGRQPPPSKLSQAISRQIAPAKSAAIEVKSNAAGEVDAAKLQGLKKFDEAKAKTAEIEQRWKSKGDEAKAIEKEAREIADQMKALGGGGDPLRKIQAATDAQKRLKALIARVDEQRAQAQKDVAEAQALVKEAAELRKKDLNGLLAAAGLPTLDSQDLAKRLLGAQTAAKLTTALKWLKYAKERAAARKAAAPPPAVRRAGVDVEFPREHSYPQYLLEGAKLSGTLDGVMGGSLDLKGLLSGVTSNPKLYGKPATLTLAGKSFSGPSVALSGRLDQQKDPVGMTLDFSGDGFSLAGTALGDGEVGGSLSAGTAKLRGTIASAGEEWKGEVFVEASGVRIEPKVALPGIAGPLVSDALKELTGFHVRIAISGTEDDLKLGFTSNIGEAVAAAMRKAVAGQIEAQKKVLEQKLASLYGGKDKDAKASADALTGKLLGPLDAQKAALDKQLKDAVSKAIGGGQPLRLDKLFKR
ncbi:MAG: TIGR03545 family protein [Elusimicrobiota bacterium]|nr:MAG: TIGR03545 family protein [Elusimicrobiota bacterium]